MNNRYTISTVRNVSDTDVVAPFLEQSDAESAIKMLESGTITADDLWWMMLGERTSEDLQEDGGAAVVVDNDRSGLVADA